MVMMSCNTRVLRWFSMREIERERERERSLPITKVNTHLKPGSGCIAFNYVAQFSAMANLDTYKHLAVIIGTMDMSYVP